MLQAALAGEFEVPEQKPFAEAWLGYSLFVHETLVPMEDVVGAADGLNKGIPSPNQVAWAFLSLRRRGWLEVQGDLYGLTKEGRKAMNLIVSQSKLAILESWISNHPPIGPMTFKEVFLSLGMKWTEL